ncbi:hypothetical protein ACTQ33_08910 [Candidatus Avoscillospira sp. LCP25S3_F1]|uniref:hypothetical protein n=1 Tax=Candidatus Avoscillospira sp. LCP25S3_F1 TaxID=3438825 RepID=UPI003F8F2211
MNFTYEAYKAMISLLREQGYEISSYHNWENTESCVILRHDIDYCLEDSLKLARLEAEMSVSSTYFVLLTSDFYNILSPKSLHILQELQQMGHEIGLHFDEKAYAESGSDETIAHILQERDILSAALDTDIQCVSMHRPSKTTLEADLKIPGMVNSYGQTFFHEFKYLSDSRHRWREPVLDILKAKSYDRLHILTHAFWYRETEETMRDTVKRFLQSATAERYDQMMDNITDLEKIIGRNEMIQK